MAELWSRGCKRRRPVVEKRISNMAELWSRGWKRRRPKLVEERALYRITQILVCYNYGYGYNSESDDDDETNKWRMSRDKASDYDSVISEDPDVESTESRVTQWVNHDVAEASRALKGKLKVADTNKDDPFYQSKHPAFFLLDDRFTDFPVFERVLDPSVHEKFHRLFTTNLGKCTLFLVLELTSSSGDLVREFCSAFLSGYAKSSMRDQIYKIVEIHSSQTYYHSASSGSRHRTIVRTVNSSKYYARDETENLDGDCQDDLLDDKAVLSRNNKSRPTELANTPSETHHHRPLKSLPSDLKHGDEEVERVFGSRYWKRRRPVVEKRISNMAELWSRGCKRRRPVVEKRISNMAELWSRGWKRRRPKLVEERALYRITQILVCYNYGYGYNSESDDDDETNKWRMSRDKASDYDSVISEDPDVESTESRVTQWVNHDVAEASRALIGKLKVADTNKDDPFYQSKHPAFFLLDDRFTDFPVFERVLDPSVHEKFHRLFTTNLGKCTLFLVLELTSSSGDLVREFCSAFLSGYAKSSMRDQIYKDDCENCEQFSIDSMKSVELSLVLIITMPIQCKAANIMREMRQKTWTVIVKMICSTIKQFCQEITKAIVIVFELLPYYTVIYIQKSSVTSLASLLLVVYYVWLDPKSVQSSPLWWFRNLYRNFREMAMSCRLPNLVCKHFLDAVEKKQYGWFWVCPNGGKTCHYRYALPKCYILISQMKALLEEEGEKMTIDEEIENQVRST
ncbi:hypothetical protein ACFE04_027809 [Oxalis oulophora]